MRAESVCLLLPICVACGESASDGSTGQGTGDTGAEEGADDDLEPGPDGPGCDGLWEGQGWWDEAQKIGGALSASPEAAPQLGRWRARGTIEGQPLPDVGPDADAFRATLISDDAMFSTGRQLAVSWCLGSILPNPMGPGPHIDEEKDAKNLARYSLLRREVERATRMWERHSRMNFVHLVGLDDRRKPSGGTCDTALEQVWFRVQTTKCMLQKHGETNAGGENEFDPDYASLENPEGKDRYLCVAPNILDGSEQYTGTLAEHETGHIVGLEHEHVRWDQGDHPLSNNCKDNFPFEPVPPALQLTPSDPWMRRAHLVAILGYTEVLLCPRRLISCRSSLSSAPAQPRRTTLPSKPPSRSAPRFGA